MKKTVKLGSLILVMVLGSLHSSFAQNTSLKKMDTDIVKAEVDKAQANYDKTYKLFNSGRTMENDGIDQIKSLNIGLKALDKEYYSNIKTLEKQLKSKDKDAVSQAKMEIKVCDGKYKNDMKTPLARIKVAERDIVKGKAIQEKYSADLAAFTTALKTAKAKL